MYRRGRRSPRNLPTPNLPTLNPPLPPQGPLTSGAPSSTARSAAVEQEASAVLDEQIGELCDALAELLRVPAPAPAVVAVDDPRSSDSPSGVLLDGSGVDDGTGIRTLLWNLRRTGLDSVEGLLPFAEPLTTERGFDVQAARYEDAMGGGVLGFEPGGDATWAGRLWPIAERSGFGYAVSYRDGPDAGSVWAYGGGQPLHRLWDSDVDLLVELFQAFTAGPRATPRWLRSPPDGWCGRTSAEALPRGRLAWGPPTTQPRSRATTVGWAPRQKTSSIRVTLLPVEPPRSSAYAHNCSRYSSTVSVVTATSVL